MGSKFGLQTAVIIQILNPDRIPIEWSNLLCVVAAVVAPLEVKHMLVQVKQQRGCHKSVIP